ncbi:MAG: hypothetical protein ACPG51_04585 [Thiolinea sp.]
MTKPWIVSILLCVVLSTVIGSLWLHEINAYSNSPRQITNQNEIDSYIEKSQQDHKDEEKYIVPVGFFTQSIKFINSSDVNLTGYIWHKYPLDFPDSLKQGFIFPEGVETTNAIIKEAYTEQHDNYLLKGWYFEVTVRQSFDYRKFPLDRKTVWLRLWSKDWSRSIRFVPDLESYASVDQGIAFGMDQNTVMGQWKIFETYFDYNNIEYDTNFGSDYQPGTNNLELYYNIVVGRKFVNAFVIYLVPLFIILAMLFSILMMITRSDKRKDIFGSSTSGAIGSTVALFFVVTLTHANIRQQFAGAGLVYIESFYFIAYIMILLVSLNTYHFTSTNNDYRLYKNDNLIAKLLYWPVVLLLMLLTTLHYFH